MPLALGFRPPFLLSSPSPLGFLFALPLRLRGTLTLTLLLALPLGLRSALALGLLLALPLGLPSALALGLPAVLALGLPSALALGLPAVLALAIGFRAHTFSLLYPLSFGLRLRDKLGLRLSATLALTVGLRPLVLRLRGEALALSFSGAQVLCLPKALTLGLSRAQVVRLSSPLTLRLDDLLPIGGLGALLLRCVCARRPWRPALARAFGELRRIGHGGGLRLFTVGGTSPDKSNRMRGSPRYCDVALETERCRRGESRSLLEKWRGIGRWSQRVLRVGALVCDGSLGEEQNGRATSR